MEYYGNDDFMFAWDLGVIFLSVLNCAIGGFSNNFLGLKGVMEKCVGCFLVYLFLRVLFFLKKILRDRKFKFLCETYPLVSCNTHYLTETYKKLPFHEDLSEMSTVIKLQVFFKKEQIRNFY